jgi:hypothetical protein
MEVPQMTEQEINLSGFWECDDDMHYHIQQNGDTIWWYGEEILDNGTSPNNVARGEIIGNTIIVSWSRIQPYDKNPAKASKGYGFIILNIESQHELRAEKKTEEFAGSFWKQPTADFATRHKRHPIIHR